MSNDVVRAPFTASEVAQIRDHQADDSRHPLTCCDHRTMEVTAHGLVCGKCGLVQQWVPSCVLTVWPTPNV